MTSPYSSSADLNSLRQRFVRGPFVQGPFFQQCEFPPILFIRIDHVDGQSVVLVNRKQRSEYPGLAHDSAPSR